MSEHVEGLNRNQTALFPEALEDYVDKLGGPEARFYYLTQEMAVQDTPKQVSWLPFGRFVTFPSEAGWFVSFYGSVS